MKFTLLIILLSIISVVFISCDNSTSPEASGNDAIISESGILRKICGNNEYPNIGSTHDWYIEWCTTPDSGIDYLREEVCLYWSHLVDSPSGNLSSNYSSCNGPIVDEMETGKPKATSLAVDRFHQSQSFELTWDFVWCDYYKVEVKRGTGSWQTVQSIVNDEGDGVMVLEYWMTNPSPNELIQFRVKTDIVNSGFIYSNVVSFNY